MFTLPETQLYIDSKLRPAAGGRTYDIIGPWTGETVGQAADASAEDVNEAIAAARRAFDTTDWSTNHSLRLDLITKLYQLLLANHERLGLLARHEGGSTMGGVSRANVIMACVAPRNIKAGGLSCMGRSALLAPSRHGIRRFMSMSARSFRPCWPGARLF
jgi:acyl-CoA reductase-like NAD-dependent aldehyde dehydrogenase